VLVDQSRWIVARAARSRSGRRAAAERTARSARTATDRPAPTGRSRVPVRRRPPPAHHGPSGVALHHLGTLPSPEVPGNRGPPVRTSHFAGSAPTVGSGHAPRRRPSSGARGPSPSPPESFGYRARENPHEARPQGPPPRTRDDVRGVRRLRRPGGDEALVAHRIPPRHPPRDRLP